MRKSPGFELRGLVALGMASLLFLAVLANTQLIPRAAASTTDCNIPDTGGANLKGANLEHCNLAGYDMQGDNLSGANLYGANLQNANLQDANLLNANLEDANLQGTSFQGANLSGANLQADELSGDNLQGANLHGADVQNAVFVVANLSGANFQGANLQSADFADANLSGANFQGANLASGVIFAGANTSGCSGCLLQLVPATQITPVYTSNVTMPNGQVVDPSCVHVVPDNAIVSANGTVVVPGAQSENIQLGCSDPSVSGMVVVDAAELFSPDSNSINFFYDYWTVPPYPSTCSSSTGILFFWNGLQDNLSINNAVLWQPVLNFGYNGGGFGCYYYANVVTLENGVYISTNSFQVYPGDTILGEMFYEGTIGSTCCYWLGEIADQTSGHAGAESESVQTGPGTAYQLRYALGGVLEDLGITSCSEFPNGDSGYTQFYGIQMEDSTWTSISPSWTSYFTSQPPLCYFGTSWPSDGSYIYLFY